MPWLCIVRHIDDAMGIAVRVWAAAMLRLLLSLSLVAARHAAAC